MRPILLALLIALGVAQSPASAEVRRLAFVQSDGTLKIGQRIYRLHGIYIPPTNRLCRSTVRPVRCASRAVLQLDSRVDRFVVCDPVARNRDRSIDAVCWLRDKNDPLGPRVDLGAWMIRNGWAVARPGAPFEYVVLERLAQQREIGIWGFPVDSRSSR